MIIKSKLKPDEMAVIFDGDYEVMEFTPSTYNPMINKMHIEIEKEVDWERMLTALAEIFNITEILQIMPVYTVVPKLLQINIPEILKVQFITFEKIVMETFNISIKSKYTEIQIRDSDIMQIIANVPVSVQLRAVNMSEIKLNSKHFFVSQMKSTINIVDSNIDYMHCNQPENGGDIIATNSNIGSIIFIPDNAVALISITGNTTQTLLTSYSNTTKEINIEGNNIHLKSLGFKKGTIIRYYNPELLDNATRKKYKVVSNSSNITTEMKVTLNTIFDVKVKEKIDRSLIEEHIKNQIPIAVSNISIALPFAKTKEERKMLIELCPIEYSTAICYVPYGEATKALYILYNEGVLDEVLQIKAYDRFKYLISIEGEYNPLYNILNKEHKPFYDILKKYGIYLANTIEVDAEPYNNLIVTLTKIIKKKKYYSFKPSSNIEKTFAFFKLCFDQEETIPIAHLLFDTYYDDEFASKIASISDAPSHMIILAQSKFNNQTKENIIKDKISKNDSNLGLYFCDEFIAQKYGDEIVDMYYTGKIKLEPEIKNTMKIYLSKLSETSANKIAIVMMEQDAQNPTAKEVINYFSNNKLYKNDLFLEYKNRESVIETILSNKTIMKQIKELNNDYISSLFENPVKGEVTHEYNSNILNLMLLAESKKIKKNILFKKQQRVSNTLYADTVVEFRKIYNKGSDEHNTLLEIENKLNGSMTKGNDLNELDDYLVKSIDDSSVIKRTSLKIIDTEMREYINRQNIEIYKYSKGKSTNSIYKEKMRNTFYIEILKSTELTPILTVLLNHMRSNKLDSIGYKEANAFVNDNWVSPDDINKIYKQITSLKNYIIEEKAYTNDMQSLIKSHRVLRVNLKDMKLINPVLTPRVKSEIKNYMKYNTHPVSNQKLTLVWVRFSVDNQNNSIWINEIQTDMTKILMLKDTVIGDGTNDKLAYNALTVLQQWVRNHYPSHTVVLPSYTTRKELLDGDPTPNGYDNPAKKLKFTKGEYSETPWNNVKKGKGLVWIWSPLTESKKSTI